MIDKELIEEARDRAEHMKPLAAVAENSPGAAVALEEADRMTRFADALSARQPGEDDREALIDVVKRNRSVVKRMSDGYPSVSFATDETIADAILAAGFSRAAVPDAATEQVEGEDTL